MNLNPLSHLVAAAGVPGPLQGTVFPKELGALVHEFDQHFNTLTPLEGNDSHDSNDGVNENSSVGDEDASDLDANSPDDDSADFGTHNHDGFVDNKKNRKEFRQLCCRSAVNQIGEMAKDAQKRVDDAWKDYSNSNS